MSIILISYNNLNLYLLMVVILILNLLKKEKVKSNYHGDLYIRCQLILMLKKPLMLDIMLLVVLFLMPDLIQFVLLRDNLMSLNNTEKNQIKNT